MTTRSSSSSSNFKSEAGTKYEIGFIGLGVMGKNLVLNLCDHGYKVACFDIDQSKIDSLVNQNNVEYQEDRNRILPCKSYTELLTHLQKPCTIILSVPAGAPVDHVCHHLIDAGIDADDIVVDTGNSLWTDSVERDKKYRGKFVFFSTAISGGEVGARFGPSLMPSGDPYAWARIEKVWQDISAKVDDSTGKPIESNKPGNPVTHGEPCTTYIGPVGAGHYVKMVHNGIEYADMQLICEAYDIMRSGLGMAPKEIASIFRRWNQGVLDSYLIEITVEVLEHTDPDTDQPLVDIIVDKAGQKGTGLWTAMSALEVGSPAQTIAQAVFARSLSSLKSERIEASERLKGPSSSITTIDSKEEVITQIHDALYCSKICAYAQGFQLMENAASENGWKLDFAEIAKIWRAGCIIRAVFLQSIKRAYENNEELTNLLLDPFFTDQINKYQHNWRRAIAGACIAGIPCAAMSSALSYYDAYRSKVLPANLLQGQRDYFGAHTFSRIDKPEHKKYHIEWNTPGKKHIPIKKS